MIDKILKISLGCDHAGFSYKEAIKELLQNKGFETKDFGTFSEQSVDYPDFIQPAAEAVAEGLCDFGIVLGGSGNGEAMAANKVKGVRCALCWSEETARLAKEHNNANVISIGARLTTKNVALKYIDIFIKTDFKGRRHLRRVKKI